MVPANVMPLLPPGSCPGSLRALMGDGDTVKKGPGQYVTICYNCEEEVDVDVLLTTISGVMKPLPRVAIHPAPQGINNA